jgi:hypothetical protein
MTDSFPVFRAPGRRYGVGIPGQALPPGQHVGSILHDELTDLFEAYLYALRPGERLIGSGPSIAEALKHFYRRPPVPPPPRSRFARARR